MKRTLIACGVLALAVAAGSCKVLFRELERLYQDYRWGSYTGEGRAVLARDGGPGRDDAYRMEGDWTFRYPDGSLRSKGAYRDDRRFGSWETWYPSGALSWVGEFDVDGFRTGAWTFFHDGGVPAAASAAVGPIRSVIGYRGDLEDGPWAAFDVAGRVQQVGFFASGKRTGAWAEWEGGRVGGRGLYRDGARSGDWIVAAADGGEKRVTYGGSDAAQLAQDGPPGTVPLRFGAAVDGIPDGVWISLHGNWMPRMVARLDHGRPAGAFLCFDAAGRPLARGELGAGRRIERLSTVDAAGRFGTPLPSAELAILTPDETGRTADDFAATAPIEEVIARWLAELAAPLPEPAPIEVIAEVPVDEAPAAVDLVPAPPVQDVLTPREAERFEDFVELYSDGRSARAAKVLSSYGPARAPSGSDEPEPRDDAAQQWVGRPFPITTLTAADGSFVDLRSRYVGKRPTLVVILRGFKGQVCWYCVAQYEALEPHLEELRELGVGVLFVYPDPGQTGAIEAFQQAYREATSQQKAPQFPILRDPDLALARALDIVGGDWAFPTTVLLKRDGTIGYIYRGRDEADRPAFRDVMQAAREFAR
ncbi:MAG: redoxin domain-containing protein [Planctomycetes bacterium]|nr:redoxin domain-containing protein [Planctomycetota bacterium]